jgi:FlaA1/EpsC-like NDP-sugar epimerase
MSNSESPEWRRFLPGQFEEAIRPSASDHAGESVLVTGAGGYIGSALVKAIAQSGPRCIVLLDSSEHNLFEIDRDLEVAFRNIPRASYLGSVEDTNLLDHVFSRFQPEVVYHAAAFKHVPLLELNPLAAVRNNVLGTYALARAAIRHGASKLILISTDKAVNPHSVMGVSKRVAELTVTALSNPACRMNAVRLGNVIGSRGGVVPLFLNQIAAPEPVTVTDPEVSRWFLSLRQTIEAVLACGRASCEGRILVPDLGEPVRIVELARFLIRASKKEIPIAFTGLRAGDKLTEEAIFSDEIREGCLDGPLAVIKTRRLALPELEAIIERLSCRLAAHDVAGLIRTLSGAVPEYVPSLLLR